MQSWGEESGNIFGLPSKVLRKGKLESHFYQSKYGVMPTQKSTSNPTKNLA